MNRANILPLLLPKAILWAQTQSQEAMRIGQPLTDALIAIADEVEVRHPEKIRILNVKQLPIPEDPMLQAAALETGLLGPNMAGLTLGYAILLRSDHSNDIRLLSHEFRHVHQYENAGSIAEFLPNYLEQIFTFGYFDSPLEQDARAHEKCIL